MSVPPSQGCFLFGWLEKIAGLGDVFMGDLIDKDQDGFGGLVGFPAYHLGHAFADVLFLFFTEGSSNPDAYVWHDSFLLYMRMKYFNKKDCPLTLYKGNHICAGKKENKF